MPKQEYTWTNFDSPPEIKPHSLAKHRVLEAYLRRYIEKLVLGPHVPELRLHIVDGFSGGGIYRNSETQEIHWGSPIIVNKIVREEEERINSERNNPFTLKCNFHFVEKNKDNFDILQKVLAHHEIPINQDHNNKHITLHNKTFSDCLDDIIKKITSKGRSHRALFILDQYGYSSVSMLQLQRVFAALPNAEILLTFATDWIIDYISNKESYIKQMESQLRSLGLITNSYHIDLKEIKENPRWRRVAQIALSESIRANSGAKHYRPFFIKTADSHRTYWFIHLSQHVIACDEMTKVHWDNQNCFTHPGGAGLQMAGYSPDMDEEISQQTGFDFEFDEYAESLSISSLEQELPTYLFFQGPMTFRELLEKIVNTTPADSSIIKGILGKLISCNDIAVSCSKTGSSRRKGNSIQLTDLIEPVQRSIFLGM